MIYAVTTVDVMRRYNLKLRLHTEFSVTLQTCLSLKRTRQDWISQSVNLETQQNCPEVCSQHLSRNVGEKISVTAHHIKSNIMINLRAICFLKKPQNREAIKKKYLWT